MGDHQVGTDSQSIHHMLTTSPWSYQDLLDRILKRSVKLLSTHKKKIYLLIDEVGIRKKGKNSACVGRQYLGCIGKHDNGQVAVVAALSSQDFYTPVDIELFMPQDWQEDHKRRQKANIPEHIQHRTKPEMALAMILKLYKKIKEVEYVVFDALYGSSTELLAELIKNKIPFVGDVRENIIVYLSPPQMKIPINKGRGPKNKIPKPDKKGIYIRNYEKSLTQKEYQTIDIRKGSKGSLVGLFHKRKVWVLCHKSKDFIALNLLIRKNPDGSIQYALGYHPIKATLKGMVKAQAQRVFIERVFEEGKNIVGMADCQVRSWQGFHRHMALCSLALLFLMEQKLLLGKTIVGKVTAYQLQELVNATIQTVNTLDEIIVCLMDKIPRYQSQIKKRFENSVT